MSPKSSNLLILSDKQRGTRPLGLASVLLFWQCPELLSNLAYEESSGSLPPGHFRRLLDGDVLNAIPDFDTSNDLSQLLKPLQTTPPP